MLKVQAVPTRVTTGGIKMKKNDQVKMMKYFQFWLKRWTMHSKKFSKPFPELLQFLICEWTLFVGNHCETFPTEFNVEWFEKEKFPTLIIEQHKSKVQYKTVFDFVQHGSFKAPWIFRQNEFEEYNKKFSNLVNISLELCSPIVSEVTIFTIRTGKAIKAPTPDEVQFYGISSKGVRCTFPIIDGAIHMRRAKQ